MSAMLFEVKQRFIDNSCQSDCNIFCSSRLFFVVIGLITVFVLMPISNSPAQTKIEKNILFLLPYTMDYPAHKLLIKGVQDEFFNKQKYKINYSYEFLDMQKFSNGSDYFENVVDFFKKKYAHFKPDVIITGALLSRLLASHVDAVFPGVPVFIPWFEGQGRPEPKTDHYVVTGAYEYEANIDLIVKTRPEVKKLLIVVGNSEDERALMPQIVRLSEKYRGNLEFVYMNSLTKQQMLDRITTASNDSAVLFVIWVIDGQGKSFMPAAVVKEVCEIAKIPVFGTLEQYLGSGIVGGSLFNLSLLGKNIAMLATDVLDGKPDVSPYTNVSASEFAFDWRQLKSWNIGEGLLPPGSRVEFRQLSAWDLYGGYIAAAVAFMLVQAGLILGLLVNRSRRIKVEDKLARLNESLEEQVAQRTDDLLKTNERLKAAKLELEAINAKLEHASITDGLTGLYNRRHMEMRINEAHAVFGRTGETFSIIMADADYFKKVNDTFGHDAGDHLLVGISRVLQASVREYDIVSRWGGEEFLVLLPATPPESAKAIAERIRHAVEQQKYVFQGNALPVTMTLGVCAMTDCDTLAELFKKTDDALYEGKRSGRNRVVMA